MKKVISLILVFVMMCALLCSCGGATKSEEINSSINSAISNFDYVTAQNLLDENTDLSNYAELSKKVKYESLMLECCKTLQLRLKDPNSLLLRSVEFCDEYKYNYNYGNDEVGPYPYVLIQYTAKNSFGGYVESKYAAFGPYDYDEYNTYNSIYSSSTIYTVTELDRFNDMFNRGTTPKIDIEIYKNNFNS